MINVRAAANAAIQVVNPNGIYPFYASTGYTKNASFAQVPSYAAPVNAAMQIQAVSARDLKHLDGMNIEGLVRSVYMHGNTQGVVRVTARGGDLLYFPEQLGGPSYIWKVVKVIETWADWCHIIVNQQTDAAPPAGP